MLLTHLASLALGWITPNQKLTGQTQDIPMFVHFSFYAPVYYPSYSYTCTSVSNEEQGRWVGVIMHVGCNIFITPNQKLTGQTQDIPMFVHFSFYEPVYYPSYSDTFLSSQMKRKAGGLVLPCILVVTYKVLTKQNKLFFSFCTSISNESKVSESLCFHY
jgi:hypothetical protein